MRFLLGIILGAFLTIGAAYLYDNQNAAVAAASQADAQRSLVNWDVVSRKWDQLTDRARGEWTRLAG
jgi:hypothetical protein